MALLLVAVVEAVANSVAVASMQVVRFQMVQKDLDQFHMDGFGLHLKKRIKMLSIHRKKSSSKSRFTEKTDYRRNDSPKN